MPPHLLTVALGLALHLGLRTPPRHSRHGRPVATASLPTDLASSGSDEPLQDRPLTKLLGDGKLLDDDVRGADGEDELGALPPVGNLLRELRPSRISVVEVPLDGNAELLSRTDTFVNTFRGCAPYIKMHSGKVMVIHMASVLLDKPQIFDEMMEDIASMSVLGVRIVLVVGIRDQVDARLDAMNVEVKYAGLFSLAQVIISWAPLLAFTVAYEQTGSLAGGFHCMGAFLVVGGGLIASIDMEEARKTLLKSGTLTTCETAFPIKTMKFSVSPVVRVAVAPKSSKDLPKLVEGMKRLSKSDPMVLCYTEDTGEHVIAGCGELHLEICLKDLQEDFMNGAPIVVDEPVVSYCETAMGEMEAGKTVMGKSANKHNKLYVWGGHLSEELIEAIDPVAGDAPTIGASTSSCGGSGLRGGGSETDDG